MLAANGDRYIADQKYRYKAKSSDGSVCLTFSLEATIYVAYKYINYTDNSHVIPKVGGVLGRSYQGHFCCYYIQ